MPLLGPLRLAQTSPNHHLVCSPLISKIIEKKKKREKKKKDRKQDNKKSTYCKYAVKNAKIKNHRISTFMACRQP
jgi:hypothetical protein